jgi:nucleotide-binding universal stress UspA family protein
MYDDILIPYDGTEQADLGAEHGVDLAASVGATVHALYVIDLPGAPRTVYVRDDEDELREEYREYGEDVTGDVCEMATEAGTDCVAAIESGSVHEEVADYAEENGIDLIVVGTPFRGKLGALLGGTSDRIVRTSPVPVTTVRESADPRA